MINVQLPAGVVIQMTVEQLAAYEAKRRGGDNPIKQDSLPLPDISTRQKLSMRFTIIGFRNLVI